MAEVEFPGNNPKAGDHAVLGNVGPQVNASKEREKKVEKIEGLGEVSVKKPSLGSRFKTTFFSGDAKGTAQHVWQNILVPMAQNALLDAIQQGSERMVVGQVRSRSSMGGTIPNLLGLGHQAYNKMYTNGPMPGPMATTSVQQQRMNRATHNFSDFVVGSRAAAEVVIDRMYDLLSRDGAVTVADFMDLIGENADYTMQKWGWVDLHGSQVVRVPQGYLIDLPRPVPLD
jgi:hypothetical protein